MTMPAPGPGEGGAPRTSESAVFSLVLGLFLCLGPFSGIPAIGLGLLANRQIRRSNGAIGGQAYATTGIALGAFNLFASIAIGVAVLAVSRAPIPPAPPVPVVTPTSPTAPSPISPIPRRPRPEEGGQMTTIADVTETRAGKVAIVDIPPQIRSLAAELESQQRKAAAAKEKLVLFTVRESCRPCMSVAAVILDPKMQAALDKVRLVRVDVLAAHDDLEDLGVPTEKIPGFYLLGPSLRVLDGITGEEWDDDTSENAAPVLGAFVRGTYTKRRAPFVPVPPHPTRAPRPPPTML